MLGWCALAALVGVSWVEGYKVILNVRDVLTNTTLLANSRSGLQPLHFSMSSWDAKLGKPVDFEFANKVEYGSTERTTRAVMFIPAVATGSAAESPETGVQASRVGEVAAVQRISSFQSGQIIEAVRPTGRFRIQEEHR